MDLVHVLGDREDAGHGPEGAAQVVEVEPGHDHPHAGVGQPGDQVHQPVVEELGLVDPHHLDVGAEPLPQLVAAGDAHRLQLPLVAGDQPPGVFMPGVGRGLEDLDHLAGEGGAAQAPDQLLALAGEHAAADRLDAAFPGALADALQIVH